MTKTMLMNKPEAYNKAVETIKTAILQGQYEAAKGVNRIQLAVYFAIGKYISLNTRKNKWGTGALEAISQQLRKELPGLRGFSVTSMKNMRKFYENWKMLDSRLSVMTDDKSAITIADLQNSDNQTVDNSAIMIAELKDDKPMGVATYKTTAEMPEELRKALPDVEELKKLL